MFEMIPSALRLSTPLIFAAMGGLICERVGIATLCLEGVLLVGAFTGAVVNYYTHNPYIACIAAMVLGAITMWLHGVLTTYGKADHIISGIAINMLAMGMTPLLCKYFFGSPTSSAQIPLTEKIPEITLPLVGTQNPLTLLAWALPILLYFLLNKTSWGLHVKASGDSPDAVRTAGISVTKVRMLALIIGGMMVSLGGVYLSIAHSSQFTRDMSAGRGFIALTAVIFGKWKPIPCFFACLLFGFADALQIELQSRSIFGVEVPIQAIQAFPYILTLLVLVGFVGRAKPPLALGKVL
jgi:simple sugar transport system permease protein